MSFSNSTMKVQVTKEKIEQLDYTKIENFCATNDTIKKVKKQQTEGEKIFANHISDKGLVSKIRKQLLQLNEKTNNKIKKLSKDTKRHFSK